MNSQPNNPGPQIYPPGYFVPLPPAGEEVEVSLIDILRLLIRYKWLIASVTILITAFALVYALVATPIYRAEVLLVPAKKEGPQGGLTALAGQFGGLASLAGIDVKGGGDTETAIATLKSRAFTESFIRDQHMLPALFREKWDAARKTWAVANPKDVPTVWAAYKKFQKIMAVSQDKKTGLVTVSIQWKDPQLAAHWANALVTRLNARLRAIAVAEGERNLNYLRTQLEKTSIVAVQQSLFVLIEAEMKKAMLANASEEYAFRVIDPAVVPQEKIKPKRTLIVLMGLVLGSCLGILAAIFLNSLRRLSIKSQVTGDD